MVGETGGGAAERGQGNRARPAEARREPACVCGEGEEGGRGRG